MRLLSLSLSVMFVIAACLTPACQQTGTPEREAQPQFYRPGVISLSGQGESSPSFDGDGEQFSFTRYGKDWTQQELYRVDCTEGPGAEPRLFALGDPIYNAAWLPSGEVLWYCRREDGVAGARIFEMVHEDGAAFGSVVDLTAISGRRGSYFFFASDSVVYYHRDGDLFRTTRSLRGLGEEQRLPAPVNTPGGVEFSGWVDAQERALLFTRAVEGDEAASGVFLALRAGDGWADPVRLSIPYGWSPCLTPGLEELLYVVDDDLMHIELAAIPEAAPLLEILR